MLLEEEYRYSQTAAFVCEGTETLKSGSSVFLSGQDYFILMYSMRLSGVF